MAAIEYAAPPVAWASDDEEADEDDGAADVAIAEREVLRERSARRARKVLNPGPRPKYVERATDLSRRIAARAARELREAQLATLAGAAAGRRPLASDACPDPDAIDLGAAPSTLAGPHPALSYSPDEWWGRVDAPAWFDRVAKGVYGAAATRALRRARRSARNARRVGKVAMGLEACGTAHVQAVCVSNHRAAVTLVCSRPGCRCVGIDHENDGAGAALQRRCRRALPKLEWAHTWGMCTVTVPDDKLHEYRSRDALKRLHKITALVAQVLRPDAPGCLTCNHEFGDESPRWRPHGNALIPLPPKADGSQPRWKVSKRKFAEARRVAARLLGYQDGREANVFYEYIPPEKQAHILRYVLRCTFMPHRLTATDEDAELALAELRKFRRVRYHGLLSDRKWGGFRQSEMVTAGYTAHRSPKREEEIVAQLDAGKCPACAAAMKWERGRGALRALDVHEVWEDGPTRDAPPKLIRVERTERWIELIPDSGYYVDPHTFDVLRDREPAERQRSSVAETPKLTREARPRSDGAAATS